MFLKDINSARLSFSLWPCVSPYRRFEEPYSLHFYRLSNVARMGEERGMYRVLVGKPEGKRPLGRPRRRWVDNIRMDLQEV